MSDRFQNLAGRLGRQSAAYAVASVVGPGTGLVLLPVYTRYLAPAEFGLIALLEVIALVLTAVFSLGMTALVPFLYVEYKDAEARKRAFGTVVVAVTAVNLLLAAIVWRVGPLALPAIFPSVPPEPYLGIVIVTVLLEPYWVMAGAALQIQERAGQVAAWSTARILVSAGLRLWFVVALAGGAQGFIIANLLSAALFAVASAVILRAEVAVAFRPAIVREALTIGGPTVPNNLLSYGYRLLDRVFLERVASLEQVGIYYLALRIADVMRLGADTLISAWRPIFFKEGHNDEFARRDAPRLIRLATVAVVSGFVALSMFARETVTLLAAPRYAAASALVPILVGAMALKSVQAFPYLVIWLRKQTRWVPILTAATLCVGVAANYLLSSRWGVMGIAAALVVSYAFLTMLMFVVARRLHALAYPWREMGIAAGLGVATVVLGVSLAGGALPLAGKLLLLAGYFVAIVVTGCLPVADLRALRSGAGLVSLEGKA